MTSWLVLVHEVEYIFEYIQWIVNNLAGKLGQEIDIGNIIKVNNDGFTYLRYALRQSKSVKHHLLKAKQSHYFNVLSKS